MIPIYGTVPFQIWFDDAIPESAFTPEDYLLFYVLKGPFCVRISERDYSFGAGEAFIVHAGETYMSLKNQEYLLCTVRMNFGFLLRCCDYERPSFYTEADGHRLVSHKGSPAGHQLAQKIAGLSHACFDDMPEPSPSRQTYLFYDFVYFLIEHYKVMDSHDDPVHQRIYQVRDLLETSFQLPLTLNALADTLKVTPQYLSAFIKKHLGVTFGDYLNQVRLNHAAYDLTYTKDTVTSIMYKNGFPNASGFNQSFKKCYHMTPLAYRRLTQTQLASSGKNAPDEDFTKKAKKLYDAFIASGEDWGLRGGICCRQTIDARSGVYMAHPWGMLLNAGNASNILNIDFNAQLHKALLHIPFKYVRLTHFLTPDTDNFSGADSVIDALKREGLLPWIVITDADCPDGTGTAECIKQLLEHVLHRYGPFAVSEWVIEYALKEQRAFQPDRADLKSYMRTWEHIRRTVRQAAPGPLLAGPSCGVQTAFSWLEALLRQFHENACMPDYISLRSWPYMENDAGSVTGSPSRGRILHIRRLIYNARPPVPKPQTMLPKIAVVDSGFVKTGPTGLNDALFMGNYLLQSSLDARDAADLIASPLLSDLPCAHVYSHGRLLTGGQGMMTGDSIFKPPFFALKYLTMLGQSCLSCGNGYIVTQIEGGAIAVLLYDYMYPEARDVIRLLKNSKTPSQASELFQEQPRRDYQFTITNLTHPAYQMTRFRLNKAFGSILDAWVSFGCAQNIDQHLLEYLRETLWPKMQMTIIQNNNGLHIKATLEPQEINLLLIQPA